MKEFYVYCGEFGFQTFDNEEDARQEATDRLAEYTEASAEGWNEEVNSLSWGKISQRTEMVNVQTPHPHDSSFDYYCEYELTDI